MIIAVDFDGTLCENRWPDIGQSNDKLINKLINLQLAGHEVILWTMRTHVITESGRDLLQEAVDWCIAKGLVFDGINKPSPENVMQFGDNSRKIYADIYIDDHNANALFAKEYLIPYTRNCKAQDTLIKD